MINDLTGMLAVVLSLGVPIAFFILYYINLIKAKQADAEVRKSLIENHIDAETAKTILAEETPRKKKGNTYATLVTGLLFIGLALGALVPLLCGMELNGANNGFIFAACIVLGGGAGLLTAFIAIQKIKARQSKDTGETTHGEEE